MGYTKVGNDIYLDRANDFSAKIGFKETYTPQPNDVITFVMKKTVAQKEPTLEKNISPVVLRLVIDPEDTKDLPFGTYIYNLKLYMAGGNKKERTFVKGNFIIGEVTHNE